MSDMRVIAHSEPSPPGYVRVVSIVTEGDCKCASSIFGLKTDPDITTICSLGCDASIKSSIGSTLDDITKKYTNNT